MYFRSSILTFLNATSTPCSTFSYYYYCSQEEPPMTHNTDSTDNYTIHVVPVRLYAECPNDYSSYKLCNAQRVRSIPNPSTHCPQLPVTPAMPYPLGGIKELPEPPVAFPNTGDFLPRLVMIAIPSTQNPLLR